MARNITAYTPAGLPPDGEVVPYLSVNREDDGQVSVMARNPEGQVVTVRIPADTWFVMARQMFNSRSRLSMTVELGRQS